MKYPTKQVIQIAKHKRIHPIVKYLECFSRILGTHKHFLQQTQQINGNHRITSKINRTRMNIVVGLLKKKFFISSWIEDVLEIRLLAISLKHWLSLGGVKT